MKYFLDTEFIEGFHKPLFGKRRHFIDLISIGIVAEDGKQFTYISNEYDYNKANDWVKENVISPLYKATVKGDNRNRFDASNFHKEYGYSNERIAKGIALFCGCYEDQLFWRTNSSPEFYGYYADYDWVLFCSLFGRMIDLPKGFPMYCRDLKQMLDEKAEGITQAELTRYVGTPSEGWKLSGELPKQVLDISDYSFDAKLAILKIQKDYPKQTSEHDALADAKWNHQLYKFLTK